MSRRLPLYLRQSHALHRCDLYSSQRI